MGMELWKISSVKLQQTFCNILDAFNPLDRKKCKTRKKAIVWSLEVLEPRELDDSKGNWSSAVQ